MIDLNRIRSLKTLEDMKQTLTEFVNFDPAVMISVYETDFNWGPEDYEADIDSAKELLERVEHRAKSLGTFINKSKKVKAGKSASPQPVKDLSQDS